VDDALRREILELVRAERAIEAIKLCRERTGLGLKEAKDLVDAVAAGRDVALPAPASPAPAGDRDLVELLKAGRKIDAIKLHRERTGLGLKEAKDAVEALAAREGIVAGPGPGCLLLLAPFLLR
jgi:ribosomal protein L7/L12